MHTTNQMECIKEKIPYENNVWAERKIILKTVSKCTMDSSVSGHVLKTGCCEHGNESSSSVSQINY
jgi:hypothetical protein